MHIAVSSADILLLTDHQEGGSNIKGLTFLVDGIFVLYLISQQQSGRTESKYKNFVYISSVSRNWCNHPSPPPQKKLVLSVELSVFALSIFTCIVVIDAQICMQYCISQVFRLTVGISFVYRGCDKILKVAAFSPSELVPFNLRHPLHVTCELGGPVNPTVVPL